MIEHFHQDIPGWCSVEQLELYNLVAKQAYSGSKFVEVGSWRGKSTSAMCVNLANRKNKKDGRIDFYSVDTWLGGPEHQKDLLVLTDTLYQDFLVNIEPVRGYVQPLRMTSLEASKLFEDKSLDFVFLDGDHRYESIHNDIIAWLPKLKPGGMLAGDDYGNPEWPGVEQAVDELLDDVSYIKHVWIHNIAKETTKHIDHDFGLNLYPTKDLGPRPVRHTFVIALENDPTSRTHLERCLASLDRLEMNHHVFWGYDGTDQTSIKTPVHLANAEHMRWIRSVDHGIGIAELACALSHMAVWAKCISLNEPIVILEHDAVMLAPYKEFAYRNCVEYLGSIVELEHLKNNLSVKNVEEISKELYNKGMKVVPQLQAPIIDVINYNYIYPMGLHAYAIDPDMARRLFAWVMTEGIVNPVDTILQIGQFEVIQTGVYASQNDDAWDISTIGVEFDQTGRKPTYTLPGVTQR